jgi:hypothetical protein
MQQVYQYLTGESVRNKTTDKHIAELIREGLAQPEQEPVAWMVYTLDGKSVCVTDNPADFTDEHRVLPLYTSPPQRQPLTAPQIHELDWPDGVAFEDILEFTRAIERAHGIGR